ncbi:leucine-rich repeat and IQ domain-containing protein 1 isoform X3 [Acanthopagrus latus]|uniref:leucine-rich repeat and IQ domain-containing protein 1 isoform X3 n=1 Tax=Acanthopagrus latus TaxID=8177 RepID=UPI00187BF2A3|nr:leucine-rich repeat and IQ domain-containing protein 1 isoform X3 [Acanthopagrus latus]
MDQPNEVCDTIMRELNDLVLSDTDESKEQLSFSSHEEGFDDIPPSLLSYFEISKSRAAVCERLILEDLEDFTVSHHPEDVTILSIGHDKDMMKLNEQVICDPENEENGISSDTHLLASTETETLSDRLCTHNMSLCSNNEDEEHLLFETRTLDISLNGVERKTMSEYEEERKKQQYEEMKLEENKRQIERDFQEELRKIMEAEKLHQKEIELMEKRAQEKLEQEFLLQQELISNLQRRVTEERRVREEEQNRIKRKREEEKVKMEAERKRMEEERKMREEEDKRKREEEKVKMEAERKRMEEERKMRDEEDKRKREEEKVQMEAERKRMEEERKMREEEDKRKREEEKIKMEEERKRQEEERRIREEEQRRMKEEIKIEEMKLKKEEEERGRLEREEKWREEEQIKIDWERRKLENEVRMMQEEQNKEMGEDIERKKEEEEERKREEEEGSKIEEATKEMEKMETERKMMIEIRLKKEDKGRKRKERKDKEGRVTKETEEWKEQVGVTEKEKEANDRKKMAQEKMDEEMRNGDENGNVDEEIILERKKSDKMYRKRLEEEKDRKNMEEEKDPKEVVRNQEGENRKIKEEQRPIVEDEKKNTDVRKIEEEEGVRRQTEKMRRLRVEDNYKKSEEDMRLREENNLDNRKMEHERKTKDEQNKREEVDKTMGEEMRIKEKEISKNRMMQVWGKEVNVVKAHELQEKREERSMKGRNEKKHTDKRENSSPREDSTSWSSSSLKSLLCPDGTKAIPQQQDLYKKISQTSARPSTGSVSLPVCLPEHTEQRRLSWMKDCIPWSKLSLQNRRKQKGSFRSRRGLRRAAESAGSLPPLCPESLLQSTGWKSLQEVTTVTMEDLPGCSLSTLAQCTQLRSLSLRRCSLKSLEGINHLPQLCYIDVQENDISFINCENMICLRVLKLGHNKLTSIHGLAGAENLDVLHLSHNSITRIAGLESVRRLQRLSVDHNQLISTKGLRDVYTLLHLDCSHNHLPSVEGLENSALLNTLDLRANSLTEPPSLNNQVLLRELHLDDNSISSLQSLTACWLPLLQHLSVAQNRITQLPSVSDLVSLENLDLRFNCISELQTVCESLEGCHLLQKVHLTGNPLQQESGWRSTLQKAVPGLQVIDDQWTDSSLSPPTAQQVTLASGSFLAFCQAQLQQTRDLLQQHSRELSKASSSLDAVNVSCQHFTEALQLAVDQRFAHEYGDANVADKHRAAGQTIPEETVDMGSANADKHSECPEIESTEKVPPVTLISDNIGFSTLDEKLAAESRHDTFDTGTTHPQTWPAVSKVNSGSVNTLVTKRKTSSTNLKMAPVFNCQDLDRQIAAAVVIQQLWRKYRQKCGNISSPSTAEKRGGRGGDGVKPGPGPSYINGSVVGQDHAATVIQAFWRGFTLRRRLASALAAVTCSDSGEDDTFEEVDVDEFVFDEAALEKHWTLPLCEDSPLRCYPVSEQPLSLKPTRPFSEPSQYISTVERKSKQAWVAPEQVDSERQRVSPLSSNRSKSPASTSEVSGLSKRSEKILEEWGFTNHHTALLMLKRAQNMKSKKHQQKRRREPSVRLALFRNCGFQSHPVEARNRKARHSSSDIKGLVFSSNGVKQLHQLMK